MPAKTKPTDAREAAARAALDLAADGDFSQLRLSDIAARAGIELTELHPMTNADGLLPDIDRLFDRAMSSEAADADDTPRERLFDVIMRRFEAMEEHRPGVESIHDHISASPLRIGAVMLRRVQTARWALVCAGLETEGDLISEPARELGLARVIRKAESAWRGEESADFARTMAALDKGLRDWEEKLKWFRNPFDRRKRDEHENAEPGSEQGSAS